MKPRIYTYKITFLETSHYYYGGHKEKKYNEYYMGSPKTHKNYWKLYTPQKEILEIFDFTDSGWIEAQDAELKLIKPVFNCDKLCLNEACGGQVSLQVLIENGKTMGHINGKRCADLKLGIFGLSKEQTIKNSQKGGISNKENKTGFCGRSKEKMSEDGIKGGIASGNINKELKKGICGMTFEQRSIRSKKTAAMKWRCLITGHISNAGGLSTYQKSRGIDTSLREKVA
jgi:hypothetical protein